MRANEFLFEDYSQRLESDINNMLISVKANGGQQVPTEQLVSQLQSMGYSVDVNSLMSVLGANPSVMNATPDSITLTGPENASSAGQTQDSASRVSDMAASAVKIG